MTVNSDLEAAWRYHNTTKHSYASVHNNLHFLDWANQPLPFKIYVTLDPLSLPRGVRQTGVAALSAIAESIYPEPRAVPDLEALALLLYLTVGITRHRKYAGGDIYFRAAACTGALYEVEVYVVCGNLVDLEAGVYHFAPPEFALRRLRAGDYRSVLSEATGGETAIVHAPLTIICTCTYWRNAWKYQARTYRHFGWDNGTLLANLLAVATALQLPAKVLCGFVDSEVNALLGLDAKREVTFSMVTIGHANDGPPVPLGEIRKLDFPTVPLSQSEVDYPEMREMHEASSFHTSEEVRGGFHGLYGLNPRSPRHLHLSLSMEPIERVILRRGSSRKFERQSITLDQLSTILEASTRGIPADFPPMNDLYLIVSAVDGLHPGAYFYDSDAS